MGANAKYAVDLGRAAAGALLFALPLYMTMEVWFLGFTIDGARLLVFLAATFPALVALAHFAGFERAATLLDEVLDAFAAFGVAVLVSAAALVLFGVLEPGMPTGEIVGKLAVASVPASIGAMLASKQLATRPKDDAGADRRPSGYGGQLFLMGVGALFLAFNVAPTEEMVLIAQQTSPWHALAIGAASLALLHALVYALGFAGQEAPREGEGPWATFLFFTVAGYGVALALSFATLWVFGRLDGVSTQEAAAMVVVLGFPAAIGAATARLVV